MPTYRYEAMNAQGQSVKQEVDANSEEEAIQKIRAMKLFPTSIKEKAGAAKRGASATAAGGKRKKSLMATLALTLRASPGTWPRTTP